MIADVQHALDVIVGAAVNLTQANGAGRAFELLLMSHLANELSGRGYQIYLLRSDGMKQDPSAGAVSFIQRGGAPAGVQPAKFGPNGPTSIVFRKNSSSIE